MTEALSKEELPQYDHHVQALVSDIAAYDLEHGAPWGWTAHRFLSYHFCPYWRGEGDGVCVSGCWTEPECETGAGADPWLTEAIDHVQFIREEQ